MINVFYKNLLRFIILLLLQVLVIKNIELGRFINPFVYVLFILSLPFETPKWLLLILAFLMGISIDMFYDTLGMHAAACVWMAFCRPRVFAFFSPREGYEVGTTPSVKHMGISWFVSCAVVLIFLHHIVLFYIEIFRLSEFFSTFLRVVLSSLFTFGLCLLSEYLTDKKHISE